jgi:hypothetical protein
MVTFSDPTFCVPPLFMAFALVGALDGKAFPLRSARLFRYAQNQNAELPGYCTIQILPVVSPMAKTILSRAMPSPTVPVS